jgi:hypothetical protein
MLTRLFEGGDPPQGGNFRNRQRFDCAVSRSDSLRVERFGYCIGPQTPKFGGFESLGKSY